MKYRMTVKLQAANQEPVDMLWMKETDALGIASGVSSYLHQIDKDQSPFSPATLSILIEVLG